MNAVVPEVKDEKIAAYIREKDWSIHPLGPYEKWPASLKSALSIMLESKFPKMVFWGEELYCFYNDAFRPSLGPEKHPCTLGMPYDDAYPEATKVIRPIIEEVIRTGESSYFVDQLVPINRNGTLTEAYWTFSHSPLRDEHGTCAGIFLDCFETTPANIGEVPAVLEARDFKSLSDSLSQPVFATDTEGGLIYSNSCLMEYTGKSFEELQAFGWADIIPKEDLEQVMNYWMEAIKTNSPYATEIRYIRYDGVARWFLVNAIPVMDSEGNAERWVGSSVDIQALKEQQQEKDIFIGMASHELKTPVTSIKGYVQLLLRKYGESGDTFLLNSLDKLDTQVKALTILIRDMLDLSKMKTGNLELNREMFSIDDLINDVIDELAHVNSRHKFTYKKTDQSQVNGDKDRVSQVLVNFLTNAIKYAPDSNEITIACESTEDTLRVSVIDQGIGLSAADLERVFERFYRSEGKDQATFPGFGIGLYIAADIIKRHHGSIGVESTLGQGSTFYFELPISNLV